MLIYPNGSFVTQQGLPNENFADDDFVDLVMVIDDNSNIASELLDGAPFEVVLNEDGKVTDVILSSIPITSEPTIEEYLLDYEFRLSMLELGL